MVGAGALITPLLGLPHWFGVVLVGIVVILIVVTAGMVSTTWVSIPQGLIAGNLQCNPCSLPTATWFRSIQRSLWQYPNQPIRN